MHTHRNTRCLKFLYKGAFLFAVFRSINKLNLTWFVNVHLCILVNISICMTRKCDRFLPVTYTWLNSLYNDRCTKYGSIKDCTDRTIRALVHLLEIIFVHTCMIWCDRRTFYCNTIFLSCFGGINRNLIICFITIIQSEIIILCIQINKRKKKFIFDHFPENSGHLISIHLYQRCRHLNFFHNTSPLSDI